MQATEPHILQASIVVFSKNYLPIARINIKRAIILIISGQAETLDFEDARQWEVRSPNWVLQGFEQFE